MDLKKFLFIFGFICSSVADIRPSSEIEKIQNTYKDSLLLVESLRLEHASNEYKALVSLCSCFNMSFPKLIKQLRCDIRSVHKAIKKDNAGLYRLREQLKELCSFLKKHKFIYEAIVFHNHIKTTYQPLFDNIDNNQDVIGYIDEHRELLSLKVDDDAFLKDFLKSIKAASHKVSKYEDYIHADYIDLKLQNYVYKIELIKLRNAILFDKRYKNQN